MLFLFILVTPFISHAQTTVSGNITTNTTWTAAQSPYIVSSTVNISSGATLTIEPGTIIKFNGPFAYLVANPGAISAHGSATQPIIFT
ncbi:MAG: hypothetical protein RI911_269, partial [Candidatus Parcubacteria bacterium]